MNDDQFGYWLSGFIDGEGSFNISGTSRSTVPACRFTVGLRRDDKPLLESVHQRTGIGAVHDTRQIQAVCAGRMYYGASWNVSSKVDCRALAELLHRYPLRSKKAQDFILWEQALSLWERRTRSTSDRAANMEISAAMLALKTEMQEGRR